MNLRQTHLSKHPIPQLLNKIQTLPHKLPHCPPFPAPSPPLVGGGAQLTDNLVDYISAETLKAVQTGRVGVG